MHGGNGAAVPRIQKLKQVECFAAANLTELKSRLKESTIVNSIRLVSFTFHIPLPSGYV